jgi:hypothetical protein
MPKVKGPLFSLRASGKIGERLTFSERKTGHQARFQRKQKDRKSFEQLRNREVYFDAIGLWRKLSEEEKNYWRRQAVGRSLSGFNLFVKNYYMNTIRKLATVKNIDFKVLGTTLIYTVPTGCKLIVLGLVVRPVIWVNPDGNGEAQLQRKSDEKYILEFASSGQEEVGKYNNYWVFSSGVGPAYEVYAGDSVELKISTAETGEEVKFDVDLIGYLIEE